MPGNVQLVVVGSVALDTIETPFDKRDDLLGGSVSYACAAASFFTTVGAVGIVGDDFPAAAIETYERLGVDLAGLQRVPGKTFRWSGVYEDDMINRRTLSTDLNVFEHFTPELPESYRDAPFLLLGNISPELQLHVLSQIRAPELVVADTMDLWINVARDPLAEVIAKSDMLTLNDVEARMLTDQHNIRKCADAILEMGPKYVVIKKGEHGAILVSEEGIFIIPAYPVDSVEDPTGAGDAFAGGFLGALAREGKTDERAVRQALLYGSVVASVGVQRFSLESFDNLRLANIENRLMELKGMMRVE